ncbi:MAG: MobF family relaxase [Bacteroidota bacterium]
MLRIRPSSSPEQAINYFDHGLAKSDYYAEKENTIGKWGGRAAKLLGLEGDVEREQFKALCYNQNPEDLSQLTARNVKNRIIAYEFTFSVPKSVSIVEAITKDKEIIEAFRTAKDKTMQAVESNMETRVRKNGKNENRTTENLVYASFTHKESRPVKKSSNQWSLDKNNKAIPDPQLHEHTIVFNATYDKKEKQWKAGKFRNIKADGQYYESLFNSFLADELRKVGYDIERNSKSFEIAGFERSLIEKYSNRATEIKAATQKLQAKAAAKGQFLSAEQKSEIGAKTRGKKIENLDQAELDKEWLSRLTKEEYNFILQTKSEQGGKGKELNPDQAVSYAIEHVLSRKSVVEHKELMIHALTRSYGSASPEQLEKAIADNKELIPRKTKDGQIYTTQSALDEEKALVQNARASKGIFSPIHSDYQIKNEQMSAEQSNAVNHALNSKDAVIVITGGAGTGKTWSVKEIAEGVKEAGLSFSAFAPSADASRGVQRADGFENATTLKALFDDKKKQTACKDGVIWVDEAGMIGNESMNRVMQIAKEQNARLLLTGDTRQHGAVERGDALRLMQKYADIQPAYISKIQRQQVDNYKQAVKLLSDGEMLRGYEALDQMGAIKENTSLSKNLKAISEGYIEAVKAKESVLVVSTTHKQGKLITDALRKDLKQEGMLAKEDKSFKVQEDLSYTDAQKQDSRNYEVGMTIQFHQNVKGFDRRGKYSVVGKDKNEQILLRSLSEASAAVEKKNVGEKEKGNQSKPLVLPMNRASDFSVYENQQIGLAKGDIIRITKNGFSNEKKRLDNKKILEVKGFTKDGNIHVSTGRNELVLDKNYRNFTHGYYTTSPSAQGKSVNKVLVMQSSASGRASNKEQFYVSASRGKFDISIYTDDKKTLLNTIQRSSARMSAMEATNAKTDEVVSIKDKLKKINQIAKVGLSKASNMWNKGKEMMNFDVKQAPSKPIKYAAVKGK